MTAVGARPTCAVPARPSRPPASALAVVSLTVAAAGLVGLAVLSAVPALQSPPWHWVGLALVATATCSAAPVLPAAWRDVWRRSVTLDVVGAVTLVAAVGGAVLAEVDQRRWAAHLTVVVVAVVVLAVRTVTERAGHRDAAPRWYPLVVLGAAALTAVVWLVLEGGRGGLSVGTAVLAAGTGAIGIATAVPLLVLGSVGGRVGVRVGDVRALAASRSVDLLVLDGLATVTDGKQVKEVDPIQDKYLRDLRWFAGALSHASDHPTGRAIAKLSAMRGNLTRVEQVPGLGISGSVDRHPVRVGRPSWLGLPDADAGPDTAIETVGVEVDLRPLGTITVVDIVPDSAAKAVAELEADGVSTVLVTSASMPRAAAVAEKAGVPEVRAGSASPPDTVDSVVRVARDRTATGARVALLTSRQSAEFPEVLVIGPDSGGDGGAEVFVYETDTVHAVTALRLLRRADASVRRNRAGALAAHGVLITLAASGLLPPLLAALAALAVVAVVTVFSLVTHTPS